MINIMSICNSSAVVNIIYIIKVIVTIITIVVPIALIVSCMISAVKSITSKDINTSELLGIWVKRIIAAIIIFFIPNIVFFIGRLATGDTEVRSCYQSASKSRAQSLKKTEEAQAQSKINAWKQEQEKKRKEAEEKKRKEQEEKEKQQRQQQQSQGSSNSEYSTGSERNGNSIYSVSLSSIDTTKYAVPVTSGFDGSKVYRTLKFNSKAASEADAILSKVAVFVKNSPYAPTLQTAGAYVNKTGYHGMGLAIDIFNRYKYKYTDSNGKTVTFTPYGKRGSSEWYNRYKKFICTVCDGNEACPQNINYHIYYNYFKPAGWCWGGNWSVGSFDPMHFERTNGACGTASKNRITKEKCK